MDLLRIERDNAIITMQSMTSEIAFELFIAYRKLYRGYVNWDIKVSNYYGEEILKRVEYDKQLVEELNKVFLQILFLTEKAFSLNMVLSPYVIMGIFDLKKDLLKDNILTDDIIQVADEVYSKYRKQLKTILGEWNGWGHISRKI